MHATANMKAGVIGSGNVGQTIALGLMRLGYDVVIGTRDASKLEAFAKPFADQHGPKIKVGTFAEAGSHPLVFLCTAWSGTESALKLAGAEAWQGTILVDVTNPIDFSMGPPPRLAVQYPMSAGETVQGWAKGARVVKAFNIVTAKYMIDARLQEGVADLFIAGEDAEAKAKVTEIAKAWHWGSVNDLGGIANAYWLETFAMLWIYFGFKNNHWTHAFKLMMR
jgi:8-hydroxy-5-deazaflavin:NADPH oxidoreductase